jgi:hypothetical protein
MWDVTGGLRSFFAPPVVRRVKAGTTKEVLNDEFGGVTFSSNISSINAQISFADDAGRSGSVSVNAATDVNKNRYTQSSMERCQNAVDLFETAVEI